MTTEIEDTVETEMQPETSHKEAAPEKAAAKKVGWNWNGLSPAEKTSFVIQRFIQAGIIAWMLMDIRNRPADQINGKKAGWAFLAFSSVNIKQIFIPIGAILYLLFGRKR
jgi:hypothetical protein